MLNEIMNPDIFHSSINSKNYFEGWYFKIVSADNKAVMAIIPGISRVSGNKNNHSFIQLLNGITTKYHYIKYNIKDFSYKKNKFDFSIEKNRFSIGEISIDINQKKTKIKGKLIFNNIKKWPDTVANPGSMGFYNYLRFMECYSQVCVLDGEIKGSLIIDNTEYDFNGGKVYIEKNWGRAFPEAWIWVQSNSFKNQQISFTCSLGKVPFLTWSFEGFLVALYVKNKFYKFTTINRSKMRVEFKGGIVKLVFKRKNIALYVTVKTNKDSFMLCYGPKNGEMIPLVNETLKGTVELELLNEKKHQVIFKGKGYSAGVEYGGRYSKKV